MPYKDPERKREYNRLWHKRNRGQASSTTEPPEGQKWGQGAAQLSVPATSAKWEVVLFLSDFHVPYQDYGVVDSAIDLIRDVQPHHIILNGDINDFFSLSRFNTGLDRLDTLQAEIDEGVELRRRIREAHAGRIDETEGNHDNRVRTYVAQNAKALHSLDALHPSRLYGWRELEIVSHPGAGFRLRPWFLVKHGTLVRAEAGATAKAELLQAGISGISGHTHRLATYRRAGYSHRQWTEQGCLCRVDPDYIVGRPNWVQGCAIGEFSTREDVFVVQEVPVVDGALRLVGSGRIAA